MKKTSVYLSNEQSERLRRLAATTGRSQAELIREGVRLVIAAEEGAERRFRSLGKGHGGGQEYTGWDANDLYASHLRPE